MEENNKETKVAIKISLVDLLIIFMACCSIALGALYFILH